MQPEDVYALTSVGAPRLSPDGRRVAYVVNRIDREARAYRSAIWVAALDGSAEPRQFTSGERSDHSPRWSPDGHWLAFVSNRDGEDEKKAKGQLYVMAADGGEPRRLTDSKESVDSVEWAPDSSRLAFARRVRDEAYEEEDDRQLTDGDCENSEPAWSPDGKRIVFTSMRGERWDVEFVEALYELEVDAEGAEPKRLTRPDESA